MTDQYWSALVPELTVTSLDRSLAFYCAAGFTVRFRRAAPPFAYLALGEAQLMLEEQHDAGWNVEPLDRPLGRGMNLQVDVRDACATLAGLTEMGIVPFSAVQDSWYAVSDAAEEGQREFLVQDPDGYLLRFAQSLGRRGRV